MRCDYSNQLSPKPCQSIDKTATLRIMIIKSREIVDLCPVCANKVEDELIADNVEYYKFCLPGKEI